MAETDEERKARAANIKMFSDKYDIPILEAEKSYKDILEKEGGTIHTLLETWLCLVYLVRQP